MLEQSLCTTHFLHEAYHSFPTLWNTRSTSVLHVGVKFKQQKLAPPPKKQKQKQKNTATTLLEKNKGHLFAERVESEDLSWAPPIVISEHVCR